MFGYVSLMYFGWKHFMKICGMKKYPGIVFSYFQHSLNPDWKKYNTPSSTCLVQICPCVKFSACFRHKWMIAPKISVHIGRKWMIALQSGTLWYLRIIFSNVIIFGNKGYKNSNDREEYSKNDNDVLPWIETHASHPVRPVAQATTTLRIKRMP